MCHAANSLRANELEQRWLGKNITLEALGDWAELLCLVQESPTLNGAVRREVFNDLRTALYHGNVVIPDEDRDVLEAFRVLMAQHPEEQRIFEIFRFITHGCQEALKTNFPQRNEEIRGLLTILENQAPPRD